MNVRFFDYLCTIMQVDNNERIVFFDGVCGLCNASVDWLLKHDKRRVLKFSPLQGETFKRLAGTDSLQNMDSIIYYRNGKIHVESTASLLIAKDIGGFWKLAVVLFVFPAFIRNLVYRFIARNRYKWFGKLDACRIPDKATRARFLE